MSSIDLFCKNLENYGWFYDCESLVVSRIFHQKKQESGNRRSEKQKIIKNSLAVKQTNKLNRLGTSRPKIDDVADMFAYADCVFAQNASVKLPNIHQCIFQH